MAIVLTHDIGVLGPLSVGSEEGMLRMVGCALRGVVGQEAVSEEGYEERGLLGVGMSLVVEATMFVCLFVCLVGVVVGAVGDDAGGGGFGEKKGAGGKVLLKGRGRVFGWWCGEV
jgi:hypothetical protein